MTKINYSKTGPYWELEETENLIVCYSMYIASEQAPPPSCQLLPVLGVLQPSAQSPQLALLSTMLL